MPAGPAPVLLVCLGLQSIPSQTLYCADCRQQCLHSLFSSCRLFCRRCLMALYGHQHSFEQNLLRCDWAPDGSRVAAGSSDRIVYIWDAGERTLCSMGRGLRQRAARLYYISAAVINDAFGPISCSFLAHSCKLLIGRGEHGSVAGSCADTSMRWELSVYFP